MASITPISRAIKSTLFRIGDMSLNTQAGVPAEFSNIADVNFLVGYTVPSAPAVPTPSFSHPDTGTIAASNYNELVIDTQPIVQGDGSYSTTTNVETYQDMPFWFLIRCDGYNQTTLQTRNAALNLAVSLVSALWADANNYMMLRNLQGFAFMQADLNVVFPDGSCIDRAFQSALVQAAHANFRAAMMITARPNDHVALIGANIPVISPALPNPNSGQPLAYPIIGASPQYRDRIMFLYPNPVLSGGLCYPNISTLVTQASSMYSLSNRDTGWPLSIDFGCILPIDATAWTPDGLIGVTANPAYDQELSNIMAFLAALGVAYLGIQSGPVGSYVPVPQQFLPADTGVNTSGNANVWSQDAEVFVSYINPDGSRNTRAFDQFLTERQVL